MMWRRLLILDIALAILVVFAVIRVRANWKDFEATHRVESVQAEAEPVRTAAPQAAIASTPQDWTGISVQNPFSFDRTDIAVVTAKETKAATPKPVLFGTMSIGNQKIAMLAPAQSGGASRPLKVGETLDNWEVLVIEDKSVVVAANGVRETIIMNDPSAQVPRIIAKTPNATPAPGVNVVTSQPAPAAPASPAAASPATTTQPAQTQPASSEEWLETPFGRVRRTKP